MDQKQKPTPGWLLRSLLRDERERSAEMRELTIPFLEGRVEELSEELQDTQSAFVRMVSRLTGTKPDPCEYGDPECAGDISEEAVKIVDKVLAGEMRLYEVDEVNALKMTVEEGSEIERCLREDLAMLLGVELTPCGSPCPGHLPKEAEGFLRELRNLRSNPSWSTILYGKLSGRLYGRISQESEPVLTRGAIPQLAPICPGSGKGLGWSQVEAGLCSCSVCGTCNLKAQNGPTHGTNKATWFAVPPHSPATAVSEAVQPRSDGEAGVGTTPSPEAPGEATAMLNEMCDRWATAWLSPGGPSHDDMLPQLAGEAYKMGILEGVKLAAEKAAEDSKLVIDIRETTSPKDWRPGIASAIAKLKGGCSAQEFIDLIWYDGWFSGKGRA